MLREKLSLAPKSPLSCAPGPGRDPQQVTDPSAGSCSRTSRLLPGLRGLLSRQSKGLGSRRASGGKPVGPSSATPHELTQGGAEGVRALWGCRRTGIRTKGWHQVPKAAEDGGTRADGGLSGRPCGWTGHPRSGPGDPQAAKPGVTLG